MDKNEFKQFCKEEFYKRGFRKVKNMYYLNGNNGVLCGILLQKSDFGSDYYINVYHFLGQFTQKSEMPSRYDHDVYSRITVLSKSQKVKGKQFITAQFSYEEYLPDEIRPYFDAAFDNWILPPVYQGKKFILDNLNTHFDNGLHPLRENEIMKILTSD